jgi:hypothetical protein
MSSNNLISELYAKVYVRSVQVAKREFEIKYADAFYRVISSAGSRIADSIARSTTAESATSTSRLLDILAHPLLEVYEDMLYEVELHFGRSTLQQFMGGKAQQVLGKVSEEPVNPWDEWDPYKSQEMQAWNTFVTSTHIKNVTDSVRADVRTRVTAALQSGRDNAVIAAELRKAYGFSKDRATRIAQTEINSAQNAAGYYSIGTFLDPKKILKEWLASGDKRTRPSHAKAHHQSRQYEKPFNVGGSLLMFPGDGSLGAAGKETIRCRCTATYGGDRTLAAVRPKPPTVISSPGSMPRTRPTLKPKPQRPGPKPQASAPTASVPRVKVKPQIKFLKTTAQEKKILLDAFKAMPKDLASALAKMRNRCVLEMDRSTTMVYFVDTESTIYFGRGVTVSAARESQDVLLHEYGHFLDGGLTEKSRAKGGIRTAIEEARAKITTLPKAASADLTRVTKSMMHKNYGGNPEGAFADIVGALSRGKYGGGHSVAYYKSSLAEGEIYANLVSLYGNASGAGDKALKILDDLFPSLVRDFKASFKVIAERRIP